MGATAFLGFLLLAAGPPLVIWCTIIARKSFLVLLALARCSTLVCEWVRCKIFRGRAVHDPENQVIDGYMTSPLYDGTTH